MSTYLFYEGADGCIRQLGDNELAHYKYLKKIKIGNTTRYFYTQEALQAYYNDRKKVADAEYLVGRGVDKKEHVKNNLMIKGDYVNNIKNGKDPGAARRKYQLANNVNDAIYNVKGDYRAVKRGVKPVAETAKMAVTPIKDPKERALKFIDKKVDVDKPVSDLKKTVKKINNNNKKASKKAYKKYKKNPNKYPHHTYESQELKYLKQQNQKRRNK